VGEHRQIYGQTLVAEPTVGRTRAKVETVFVGITGHQRLENASDWAWIENAIEAQLAPLASGLVGISSLAEGADQVFARSVLGLGGRLIAVIPFSGIERSFSSQTALQGYRDLVRHAQVEVLPAIGSDEDCYFAAGRRVVEHSQLLFAVWNGKEARGKGGTGDIVKCAQSLGLPILHFNPLAHTISQI